MRVAVLGAGGSHKTEASIVRAARALGHDSRLVNVVGWRRYAGPLAGRAVRTLTDAFAPDFVILTRHAILAGAPALRALLRGREAAFWYFDLEPTPAVLELGRLVDAEIKAGRDVPYACLHLVETPASGPDGGPASVEKVSTPS